MLQMFDFSLKESKNKGGKDERREGRGRWAGWLEKTERRKIYSWYTHVDEVIMPRYL